MDIELDELISAVDDGADTPLDRVSSAALLKDQIEGIGDDLLDHFVKDARDQGCSWTQIGEALGVTRQAAQQRHGGLVDRLLAGLKEGGRFKRFTPKARSAVAAAQTAASARNNRFIGTEHLLLGLFAAGDSNVAVVALDRLGVDPAAIGRLIDQRVERGDTPVRGHIPFTPRAKKTLERALREALDLGHNYIGTEHILLALCQVEDGVAAQVLAELDVTHDELRTQVVTILVGIKGGAD